MSDIRLESMPFEIGGKKYLLRCNMNVLADVQEAFGGDFASALDGKSTMKSVLTFLAAMLNDYADEQGWEEHFTVRSLGRHINKPSDLPMDKIMALVVRSITPEATEETPEESGN